MIHARNDYQGIQDTTGQTSIKEDEPVFLLRAKDVLAPETVKFWAKKLKELGGDVKTANHLLDWADKMRIWQMNNEMKLPDTPTDCLNKD